jgi:diguanylate cyclase (GGDEF)-like protein
MRSDPPVRQLDQPRVPAPARTSGQVRRFAVLWGLAASIALVVIILTSVGAYAYRSAGDGRARAADAAEATALHRWKAAVRPARTTRLAVTANRLAAEAARADADAAAATRLADLAVLVVTLMGMAVLLAGGALTVHKAWRLAVEADRRRDRGARWAEQIEQILGWSSRAKEATTRSQLIGFAHMAPREAIGAACLSVAEGGPPRHSSHGLARITLPVDAAGEGLHASVCFAPGRGDELDHHALDLMLGHLAALWRTVLRQEELERAAGHDALTGLPNRRTFESDLRRRVAISKRRELGFTLAMVDLDHFKDVNDSFGHPEGDAVLRRAGEAVRHVLRGSDRIYRLGGEEFALLLETTDPDGVADLLDRARQAVRSLAIQPGDGQPLSASIGWAVFPDDADDRAELVRTADAALYRAKSTGRDRVLGSKAA